MSDQIGNITVPEVAASGTFPLDVPYGVVETIEPQVAVHRFEAANGKREQRFLLGNGARRWQFWLDISAAELDSLLTFWEARKGAYQPFTWNKPLVDGTTEAVTVKFVNAPLTYQWGGGMNANATI